MGGKMTKPVVTEIGRNPYHGAWVAWQKRRRRRSLWWRVQRYAGITAMTLGVAAIFVGIFWVASIVIGR
jgi:hypothetical protein